MMKRLIFVIYIILLATLCSCGQEVEFATQSRTYEYNLESEEFLEDSSEEVKTADRQENLDLIWTLLQDGKDVVEGIKDYYPETDFKSDKLKIDETTAECLVLTSRLEDDMDSIKYYENADESIDEYIEFELTANNVEYYSDIYQINENLKQLDGYRDRIITYSEEGELKGVIVINLTISNLSDKKDKLCVGDIDIYKDLGEIGDYSVMWGGIEFIDFDYLGDERGKDKSDWMLDTQAHGSYTFNCLYAVFDDTNMDSIYIKPNALIRNGVKNDEGWYYPSNDEKLKYMKINLELEGE